MKADVADVCKTVPTLNPSKRSWSAFPAASFAIATRLASPCAFHAAANTGATVDLLALVGTVPINYKGATYHIPCCFFVTEGYPGASARAAWLVSMRC